MMVYVRLKSALVPPGQKALELEIASSSSVRQAVEALRQEGVIEISEERLRAQLILVNHRYATLDDPLRHGDEVMLLEVAGGG